MTGTPLQKMVLYAMELGIGNSWIPTDLSIQLAGCSVASFHRAISVLKSRGLIRKTSHGTYESRLERFKGPMNYKYHKMALLLDLPYKEKLLLLTVTSFINKAKNYCWVTDKTLMRLTGMTPYVYNITLEILTGMGLVEIKNETVPRVLKCPFQILKNGFEILKIPNQILKIQDQILKIQGLNDLKNEQTPTLSWVSEVGGKNENYINTYKKTEENKQSASAGVNMQKALTAKEIIEKVQQKKSKEIKGSRGKQLTAIWKELLGSVCELKNMNDLYITSKQQGQLNNLAKQWGPDSPLIFTGILKGWKDAVDYIEKATGADKVPAVPHIGFILANAIYFQMYYNKITEPVSIASKYQPVSKTKKLTWEEIKAKGIKELEGD